MLDYTDEVVLEQYFQYHNMSVEERNLYINLIRHCKDIMDSEKLLPGKTKVQYDLVVLILKKTSDGVVTFNGAVTNDDENRWIDGAILNKGNKYAIATSVYRLSDRLDEDEKEYTVSDQFRFKDGKIQRRSMYSDSKAYYEAEFDGFDPQELENYFRSKIAPSEAAKKLKQSNN